MSLQKSAPIPSALASSGVHRILAASLAEKRSRNNPMIDRAEGLGMTLAELYYRACRDYETDLTHRAIGVLQFISHHDQAPRLDEITAYFGSAPSTASDLIKRLQNRCLVVRNPGEAG